MMLLDSETVEPPLQIITMIDKIAPLIARQGTLEKGLELEQMIRAMNNIYENCGLPRSLEIERSSILKKSDPYHAFYRKKLDEYVVQYQEGTLDLLKPLDATDFSCRFSDLEDLPDRNNPPVLKEKDLSHPQGITLMELGLVKLTALFVARYGESFRHRLISTPMSPRFSFLKVSDSRYSFFKGLLVVYQRVMMPLNVSPLDTVLRGFFRCLLCDDTLIDLHALVSGVDCFAHLDDSATIPPPQPLFGMMLCPDMPPLASQHPTPPNQPLRAPHPTPSGFPVRLTLQQLGTIKLTALFVARYGTCFRHALMMRVLLDPRFQLMFYNHDQWPHFRLMEPDELKFHIFSHLVDVYSRVVNLTCQDLDKSTICPTPVLAAFFLRFDKTMVDLHASYAGVDYFAHLDDPSHSAIMAPPEHLSVLMNRPNHSHPGFLVLFPPGDDRSLFLPQPSLFASTLPPRITLKELAIMKLTAQFYLRCGDSFKLDLMAKVYNVQEFSFLKHNDSRRYLYDWLVDLYGNILKCSDKVDKADDGCRAIAVDLFFHCFPLERLGKGAETCMVELQAFLTGIDYLAQMENAEYSARVPPTQCFSVMMNHLTHMHPDNLVPNHAQIQDQEDIQVPDLEPSPLWKPTVGFGMFSALVTAGWVTHKELAVMKLTAIFTLRYGMLFCRDLMKKTALKPHFSFMEPTDRRFSVFEAVTNAYSKVIKSCHDAYNESVLDGYLRCLQGEKLEEGTDDLFAFVQGVDCFAHLEDDSHYAKERPCRMLVRLRETQPTVPEEPEAKRQKCDDSEGHPVLVKVSVPTVDGRQVLEIEVKSLAESVASLKEIIGRVKHMPTNRHKLSGEAGVLKENKSLADYNVGNGEILKLSVRSSRWT